ncbi:MAG TPA: glycoside hydrolase family 16 protein [Baekduia sp.]|nr:glycoside hydrolase family 16 protein [Baekduia sp.]
MPRFRSLLLLIAAFACVVVPSVAFGKSAAWSWSKAVDAPGRYDVTIKLKKLAGHKAGQDVLRVTGPDGKARSLDAAVLPKATATFTVAVPAKKLALRFAVRRGKPAVATTTVGAAKTTTAPAATPTTATTAKVPAITVTPTPTTTAAAPATTTTTTTTTATAARKLLFDDEFDGAAGALPSSSAWDPQEGAGWGTGQLQNYTARTQNVKVDGSGNLALIARKESYQGSSYTSARLQTKDRFSFTYGRAEARIKVPSGTGIWPAFWMLGDDIYTKGWPEAGEIDVMETIGSLPNELNGTVHAPLGAWSGSADVDGTEWTKGEIYTNPTSLSDAFHVYAVEWKPASIEFSIDGKTYFTINKSQMPAGGRWTFDHPNHLLLNLAVGGEWPGSPTSATPFPSTMLVDYVRVYAPQS